MKRPSSQPLKVYSSKSAFHSYFWKVFGDPFVKVLAFGLVLCAFTASSGSHPSTLSWSWIRSEVKRSGSWWGYEIGSETSFSPVEVHGIFPLTSHPPQFAPIPIILSPVILPGFCTARFLLALLAKASFLLLFNFLFHITNCKIKIVIYSRTKITICDLGENDLSNKYSTPILLA